MELLMWVAALIPAALALLFLKVLHVVWWKPLQVKKHFEAQGVHGPPYKLVYGNAPDIVRIASQESRKPLPLSQHDIFPRVYPAYHQWSKLYGEDFLFWFGTKPRLFVPHPELAKDILSNKFGCIEKVSINQAEGSLIWLEGEKWAQHRKILNPAFHIDLLKGMLPSFIQGAVNMLEGWSKLVSSGPKEIEVLNEFRVLSCDVISRTAFGSSYTEGKEIFFLHDQLLNLAFENSRSVYIPGSRYLLTRRNRKRNRLENETRRAIMRVNIEAREKAGNEKDGRYGNDLLGFMLASNKKQVGGKVQNMKLTIDEIISECQTFYVSGQETTQSLMTWTMILLAAHPEWQERARREVLQLCGDRDLPNADTVNGLKIMGMIFNESLRLYPPALGLTRVTRKPIKLGRLSVPAETQLFIPIVALHNDPALWGDDVHEFNPERFSQGIAKAAKHPMAFMPFGFGPRFCIGQNFALLEAKVAFAMILQRFSFATSPQYIHAPVHSFTLKPQHGAQLILKAL